MDFKEFQEKVETNVAYITEMQFSKAIAKVLESDPIADICHTQPVMMMAFMMFGIELQKELFDHSHFEENNESEATK